MKRFLPLLLALLLAVSLAVPVFADDEADSADSPDTSEPDFAAISPEPADTSPDVSDFSDTANPIETSAEGVTNDAATQTPQESTDGIPAIPVEDIPVQYLALEEAGQADSSVAPAFSAVSVYDLAPVPSGSDTPVSSKVSYSLTSINCPAEHIEWWFQDGYFTVVLTDAWFNEWFPGVDKAEALLNLAAYSYSLTANGSPLESYLVDFDCASLTFPYVDDGLYVFSSDSGFYLDMQITSTTVSGSLSGSSLISAVTALFGEYTPKTYNVTTYLSDGTAVQSTEIVPGLAGLDYEWIAGAAFFALVLYGLLRLIGGLIKL